MHKLSKIPTGAASKPAPYFLLKEIISMTDGNEAKSVNQQIRRIIIFRNFIFLWLIPPVLFPKPKRWRQEWRRRILSIR